MISFNRVRYHKELIVDSYIGYSDATYKCLPNHVDSIFFLHKSCIISSQSTLSISSFICSVLCLDHFAFLKEHRSAVCMSERI